MKDTLDKYDNCHNIPACFLEYQIMIKGAISQDSEKNELHALFKFLQKRCLDDNDPVTFAVTDWLKLYAVLHHTVHNTIFLITEDEDFFTSTLEDMFIFYNDIEFDVRYQLFLNLIHKIPINMAIKLLSTWFTHEKHSSHRTKLNKALSSCVLYCLPQEGRNHEHPSYGTPKIPCTQISTF